MGGTVVVGAGGTLGGLLVERLGAAGLELRCPDPREDRAVRELADADAVINLSGPRVRPGLGWADYLREHVGVTTTIARSMRAGARLVHVSSTAVFGARGQTLDPGSREAPTRFPSAPYACAKLAAEMAARAIGGARGLELVVLRPSMVYGPGVDSALSTLRRLHRRGVRLRLSPGGARQHLLHVDTFVRAVERAVTASAPPTQPLIVADPFVLRNDDLTPPPGISPAVPLDVRWAAAAHGRLVRHLGLGPASLEALAVLAMDNEFDVAPTWAALGLDPGAFGRGATFDTYWGAP